MHRGAILAYSLGSLGGGAILSGKTLRYVEDLVYMHIFFCENKNVFIHFSSKPILDFITLGQLKMPPGLQFVIKYS